MKKKVNFKELDRTHNTGRKAWKKARFKRSRERGLKGTSGWDKQN